MIERFISSWVKITQIARKRYAWLGYILVAASILYLIVLLIANREQFAQIPWEKYWGAGLISLLLYLFSQIPQLVIWMRMMRFHHHVGWKDFRIFFQSMLLRRIPGGVWHWVGRVSLYSGTTDIAPKTVLYANFWEWALIILVAVGIIFTGEPVKQLIGGVAAIIGSIAVWGLAIWIAYKWFPHNNSKTIRILESAGWAIIYSVAWLMGGLIIYVFSKATEGVTLSIWNAVWVWAVAGGISWILIIVPSGLGIREITLTTLLQPFMSIPQALVIAIAIRLVFLAADFLWGGLGWAFGNLMVKHFNREEPALTNDL